jgi:hypothetical protein
LFRTLRYEWDEVDNFHVHTVKTHTHGTTQTTYLVAFDTKAPSRQKFSLIGRLFGERIPVDRPDGALPDTYGRNPSELVQLLRSYHDRYATGARGGG